MLCSYGCGKESKYFLPTVKKWCCSKSHNQCDSNKKKNSLKNKGKRFSEIHRQKLKKSRLGKTYEQIFGEKKAKILREQRRQQLLNGQSLKMLHVFPYRGFKNFNEWMLNGGASYLRSFTKKVSKDELKLRNLVKEIYPNCKFQHQVLNYELDIALVNEKIAIEYDGYYHFDTEEHKQYHKLRQEKIEEQGWKFLRYTMFDSFPSLNILKEKLEYLMSVKQL